MEQEDFSPSAYGRPISAIKKVSANLRIRPKSQALLRTPTVLQETDKYLYIALVQICTTGSHCN